MFDQVVGEVAPGHIALQLLVVELGELFWWLHFRNDIETKNEDSHWRIGNPVVAEE